MCAWRNFINLRVPASPASPNRPRFSLTEDILSYRLCSRQYGMYGNDGFVPPETVQIFFGTIIHQVLDRAHRQFSGLMPGAQASVLPTDQDIESYFGEVENALRSQGIRAINQAIRDTALRVCKAFNRVEGPTLYPRVLDTEYRLEADQTDYILRGVVDVLADGETAAPQDREIWDYKGTKRPSNTSPKLQDYEWQMCVYAELYRVKTGVYPAKAVLYFMSELDSKPPAPPITQRPPRAVYEIQFTPQLIQQAMSAFNQTAQEIILCRNSQTWPNPVIPPGQESCDICGNRWSCPQVTYPRKFPI